MKLNWDKRNLGIFSPNETVSNHLSNLIDIKDPTSIPEIYATAEHISADGRVIEVLNANLCQGWLEEYLLTCRHGMFSCYEAFIHIVESMFKQYA